MGIFSNEKLNNDDYSIDTLMEDSSIDYSLNDIDYIEESYNIMIETYNNWCKVYKQVHIREAYLYKEDEYYPFNENFVEDLIMGIKKFLVHLWRAIESMFKSFTMWLNKHMLNDKSFLNKYRKELTSKLLDDDFTFTGYIFTIDENEIKNAIALIMQDPGVNTTQGSVNGTIPDAATNNTYGQGNMANPAERYLHVDDEIGKLRALILSKFSHSPNKEQNRKLESKDFLEELNASLRNGKDSPEEIDNKIDVTGIMAEMESSNNTRKTMNTALKEGKRAIDQANKDVMQKSLGLSKEPVSNPNATNMDTVRQGKQKRTNEKFRSDQMKEYSYFLKYVQQSRNILLSLEGCVLKALKDRSNQNKAAIIAVIQFKGKNEETITEHYQGSIDYLKNPFINLDFK